MFPQLEYVVANRDTFVSTNGTQPLRAAPEHDVDPDMVLSQEVQSLNCAFAGNTHACLTTFLVVPGSVSYTWQLTAFPKVTCKHRPESILHLYFVVKVIAGHVGDTG